MRVEKLSRLRFLSLATNSDPVSFRSTYFTLTIYLLILIAFYNRVVAAYPPKGNDWSFQSQLNFKLMELVKQYASGKPSVSHLSPIGFLASSGVVHIFCNTRKGCTQSAEALAKEYRELLASNRTNQLPWPKPPRLVVKPMDSKLANLMEIGIAAHHAGMDNSDRRLIEEGFINGSISIVCESLVQLA